MLKFRGSDLLRFFHRIFHALIRSLSPLTLTRRILSREFSGPLKHRHPGDLRARQLWLAPRMGARRHPWTTGKRIDLISMGKAAVSMFYGAISSGAIVDRGLVISPKIDNPGKFPASVKLIEAEHPIPGKNSFFAGNELKKFVSKGGKTPLVVLISGGSSSLAASPISGLPPRAKREVHRVLVRSGLKIQEINCVRRHLSSIKGGKLLKLALNRPRPVHVFAISDVIGDSPFDIGSGPFFPDPTSPGEAYNISRKLKNFPKNGSEILKKNAEKEKTGKYKRMEISQDLYNFKIIAKQISPIRKLCLKFKQEKEKIEILPFQISGSPKEFAGRILSFLRDRSLSGYQTWWIAGGEAEVRIPPRKKPGKGGRASTLVLEIAITLFRAGFDFDLAVMATDGEDGNSGKSGGFLSSNDLNSEMLFEMENSLKTFDTSGFLTKINRSFPGESTGTNFGDVLIFRVDEKFATEVHRHRERRKKFKIW